MPWSQNRNSRVSSKFRTRQCDVSVPRWRDLWTGVARQGQGAEMPRLRALLLSTTLLASSLLGGAAYAGTVTAQGSDHHGQSGHDRALSWQETVVDADQSFRGLDAVDRRTAWVTGGSVT